MTKSIIQHCMNDFKGDKKRELMNMADNIYLEQLKLLIQCQNQVDNPIFLFEYHLSVEVQTDI